MSTVRDYLKSWEKVISNFYNRQDSISQFTMYYIKWRSGREYIRYCSNNYICKNIHRIEKIYLVYPTHISEIKSSINESKIEVTLEFDYSEIEHHQPQE